MRELPLLLRDEMVRAVLDGIKTETRRPVKPPEFHKVRCPYGEVGDRLWVREAWAVHGVLYDDLAPSQIHCSVKGGCWKPGDSIWYRADGDNLPAHHGQCERSQRGKWRPSIHMPRWASRINLEIVEVRFERVQDISEEGATAEGVRTAAYSWPEGTLPSQARDCGGLHRNAFRDFWELLYATRGFGWDANPWVWVVKFRRID